MRHSDSLVNITEALVTVQSILQPVVRGSEGQVGTRVYKYASLNALLEEVRAPLLDNGLAIVQLPSITDGGRHVLSTLILHTSGEFIEGEMDLGDTTVSQALGSAITYARRYSLGGALRMTTEEDDDGASNLGRNDKRPDLDELVKEMAKVSPDPGTRRKFVLDTLKVYPEEVPSYAALTVGQVCILLDAIKELERRPAS
jgi:ERF superfamily